MVDFSIIVPIYNCEKYIHDCINSIINQKEKSFELILVDDGSTDTSGIICDQFSSIWDNIKVIHKLNEGVLIARYIGLCAATGNYIAFVDSDDWLDSEYLSTFKTIIDEYSPDIVYGGYIESGKEERKCSIELPEGYYDNKKIRDDVMPVLLWSESGEFLSNSIWGKVFKKELIEKNIIRHGQLTIGEDLVCTKSCIYNSNAIYFVDSNHYYYRVTNVSITRSKKAFDIRSVHWINNYLAERIDLNDAIIVEQYYRQTVQLFFQIAASQFNRHTNKKEII